MAGLAKESVILGINDAKIFPIITDDASTLTYGAGVDVPGITSLKLTPTFIEKQLKGRSGVDTYKLEQIDWSIEHGVVSLDALGNPDHSESLKRGWNQTPDFHLTRMTCPVFQT